MIVACRCSLHLLLLFSKVGVAPRGELDGAAASLCCGSPWSPRGRGADAALSAPRWARSRSRPPWRPTRWPQICDCAPKGPENSRRHHLQTTSSSCWTSGSNRGRTACCSRWRSALSCWRTFGVDACQKPSVEQRPPPGTNPPPRFRPGSFHLMVGHWWRGALPGIPKAQRTCRRR